MTLAPPAEIAERYRTIREEVGDAVTIVAATKYVSPDEMSVLADAGVEVVGETGPKTSNASTPSTAMPSDGTSSGICSRTR